MIKKHKRKPISRGEDPWPSPDTQQSTKICHHSASLSSSWFLHSSPKKRRGKTTNRKNTNNLHFYFGNNCYIDILFSASSCSPLSSHERNKEWKYQKQKTMTTVITGNFRPAIFPSQLNGNSARFLFRPFTTPVFKRSLTAKVRAFSTAFVETKPTVCKQRHPAKVG